MCDIGYRVLFELFFFFFYILRAEENLKSNVL